MSIVDKIRNLLRRTTENGASEAEVESAMKIAQKLMEQHSIELSEVMEVEQRSFQASDIREEVVRTHCKIDRWEKRMAMCVCVMTDTKCYKREIKEWDDVKKKYVKIFQMTYYGETQDVLAAHCLYVELLIVFKAMARHRLGKKWSQAHYHYMEGFGAGMLDIFYAEKARMEKARAANTTAMIIAKHELIQIYEQTKLNLVPARSRGTRKSSQMGEAFSSGRVDGAAYNAASLAERPNKLS